MKWNYRSSNGSRWEVSAEEAVRLTVDNAPDYHAGTVETAVARLNKLIHIVGTMLEQLPESVQREVVAQCGYNMEEVKP